MSRVPLREALKILEAQGILESTPHRGTHIATFENDRIDEICEARIALERIALRGAAAAYQRNPEEIVLLDRILAAMERAAIHMDWLEISQADLNFHREICRASGNTIVQILWGALARHVLIIFGKENRDERDAKVCRAVASSRARFAGGERYRRAGSGDRAAHPAPAPPQAQRGEALDRPEQRLGQSWHIHLGREQRAAVRLAAVRSLRRCHIQRAQIPAAEAA